MKQLILVLFFTQAFLGSYAQRQSPIAITTKDTIPLDGVPPLTWFNYFYEAFDGTLEKENTTVSLKSNWNGYPPYLVGGPLKEEYVISSVHWHWGNNDKWGSEHVIDGKRSPIEMHIVTHKKKYADLNEAIQSNDPEALAVVGYLFKIKENPSQGFTVLGKALLRLKDADTFHTIFDYRILGPKYIANYYTYQGSLTTPPYSENVIWIVSQDLLRISPLQLKAFRSVQRDGVYMYNNFRALQPLNGRKVYSL